MTATSAGPLDALRVIDFSALGPGPFASMILAAHGADVIHVQRPGATHPTPYFNRDKRSLVLDLRAERDLDVARRLVASADVVLEGFRPGSMERLGLGPDELCARHPALIYVRLTGWGQDGPYAARAGHDINYIAVAGGLGASSADPPAPPGAVIGDFAGGGLFAVIGTLLAVIQRSATGRGQVVDTAIVDGVTTLMWSALARSLVGDYGPRGSNLTDGGRPYYRAYECADARFFALGAIEPQFFRQACSILGLSDEDAARQDDPSHWATLEGQLTTAFRGRPRDEWTLLFRDVDACATPVLEVGEVLTDPHVLARGMVVGRGSGASLRAAPRLSAAAATASGPVDRSIAALLAEIGVRDADAARLIRDAGAGPAPTDRPGPPTGR